MIEKRTPQRLQVIYQIGKKIKTFINKFISLGVVTYGKLLIKARLIYCINSNGQHM